jgi:hypothetical protein
LTKGLFHRLCGELEAREQSPGLRMSDLLAFPEPVCGLLNWMIRQVQVSLADVAAWLGKDEAQAREILRDLLDKGFIREIEMRGVTTYRVRLAPKRGRTMPPNLWEALEVKAAPEEEQGQ